MEKNPQTLPCHKIVLFGPESTGKTTLAKALASHYNTAWVPEYAREYLQKKWDQSQQVCDLNDLSHIALGQFEAEEKAAQNAHRFLFCDTNVWVTKVWSETHFNGYCSPDLLQMTQREKYAHYFLTSIDVPWEKDDLRDRPEQRDEMFLSFQQQLETENFPYTLLRGNPALRLKRAIDKLEELFPLIAS